MKKILAGKKAIITGSSQGLGFKIACKFILAGADIMVCGRNKKSLSNAKNKLIQIAKSNQKIITQVADISKQKDVKLIVAKTLKQLGGCHILVNNAGILGPKDLVEKNSWDEWIKTIEINLFGSVMMCRELIKHFKKQSYGKIIQLSGGGATKPRPNFSAYATSKVAIVRFCETLAEEVRGTGIDVNSIAPGVLNTRMLDEILKAGPNKVGQHDYKQSLKQIKNGSKSLEKGSDLAVFLASSASDGITAKLISALWDNWKNWPLHLDDLSNSDIYTIRRIIGKDRNHEWGDK